MMAQNVFVYLHCQTGKAGAGGMGHVLAILLETYMWPLKSK